jgi:hypothetical protein
VTAAELGVSGYPELPLVAGGAFPVDPVFHGCGQRALALPVGIVHCLVARGQGLLAAGFFAFAATLGGAGFGGGAEGG